MKIGFIVNEVATEKADYTTVGLAYTAHKMGHEPFLMGVGDLTYFPEGHMGAMACTTAKKCRSAEVFLQHLQDPVGKKVAVTSHDLDVLWIRNDPSVDTEARSWAQTPGVVFGKIAIEQGCIVLNHPDTLFNTLNKMYFQHFPESVRPKTIISRNAEEIRRFYEENGKRAVLKPLQGSGGKDVFLLNGDDSNLHQIVEVICRNGYVIAQEYLPAAKEGDVRLFVLNGEPFQYKGKYAAVRRLNRSDDFRSNVSAGGSIAKAEVNDTMLEIVEKIRPRLIEDGIFCIGIDIAGDKLMEVNVFSPGGLQMASNLLKVDFFEAAIKALERKVYYKSIYRSSLSNKQMAVL